MIMNVFLSAFGKATITRCIKYVQCGQGCDIQASRSSSFGTGDTTQKYFPMNGSLLIYPVIIVCSLCQDAKSINYEISKKIFSFYYCHIVFVIYVRKFTI